MRTGHAVGDADAEPIWSPEPRHLRPPVSSRIDSQNRRPETDVRIFDMNNNTNSSSNNNNSNSNSNSNNNNNNSNKIYNGKTKQNNQTN